MTNSDKEDFRQYCRQCTDAQLRSVYEKERNAKRTAYANIARSVLAERGLFTDDLITRRAPV